MSKKFDYFTSDSAEGKAAFAADWQPVEERLRKILPLTDTNGATVTNETLVVDVDFAKVADALKNAPDTTGLVARFLNEVRKKNGKMTVGNLLTRPAAELTRWRKMGNKVTLLPNALVLHMNSQAN